MDSSLHRSPALALASLLALTGCGGGSENAATGAPVAVSTPTPSPTPSPTPTSTPSSASIIRGSEGDDVLYGTESDDQMFGLNGNDSLFGLGGNDQMEGDQGVDTLHGGPGDDILLDYAAAGAPDTLYGDGGADLFLLSSYLTSRFGVVSPAGTIIGDFESGRDNLLLRIVAADGEGVVRWLGGEPFTGQSGFEVRLVDGELQADADGDRVPEFRIQVAGTIKPSDVSVTFDPFGY